MVLQVHAFLRGEVHSIEVLVLLDAQRLLYIVIVPIDLLVIEVVLLQYDLLQQLVFVTKQLGERLAVGAVFEGRPLRPHVYLILADIHLEYDVVGGNVFVVLLEAGLRIDLRQNLVSEVVIEDKGELVILVRNLAALVVEEVLLNVLAHFLLLVLDVRGNVLLLGRVQRVNEVDVAIGLREEEGLVEFLLQAVEVNFEILRHDHVLVVPLVEVAPLVFYLGAKFGDLDLEVHSLAFHDEGRLQLLAIVLLQEEANLKPLIRIIALLILGAIIDQLSRRHVEDVDVGALALVALGALINLVADEDELVAEEVDLLTQLILPKRLRLRSILHEADLEVFEVLVGRRLHEVAFHHHVAVNWERVVIDRELLERRAVRVTVQLEAVLLSVLAVVIRMLILRQKEVIAETASAHIEELVRYVVQLLILLLKLLQLLIKFEKLHRMNLILLLRLLWLFLLLARLLPLDLVLVDLRVVARLPLPHREPQELLARQLVDFVVGEHVYVDLAALRSGVVDLPVEELEALLDLALKEALLVVSFEAVAFEVTDASVAHVLGAPILQQVPVLPFRINPGLSVRSLVHILQVLEQLRGYLALHLFILGDIAVTQLVGVVLSLRKRLTVRRHAATWHIGIVNTFAIVHDAKSLKTELPGRKLRLILLNGFVEFLYLLARSDVLLCLFALFLRPLHEVSIPSNYDRLLLHLHN